jgi:PAS domain S-box-containing protein
MSKSSEKPNPKRSLRRGKFRSTNYRKSRSLVSSTDHPPAVGELELFFNLSLDLLAIAGFDGYFKRINRSWERVLGYSEAELLSVPYIEFIHPDDRARSLAAAQKITKDLQLLGYENRYRCRDGSYRWLMWNAIAVPEQELIYCVARDITDRQQTERERVRAASLEGNRLIAILEASTDYIGMADCQGRVMWNNKQLKRIMDLSPDADVSHLSVSDYHPQWALDIIFDRGLPTAIQEGIWVGETALLRGNGSEMPVSQMIIAHKSPAGEVEYFSTVMRDLSVFKPIEAVFREQTQFLRSIYEGVSQPIFVVDVLEDGNFYQAGWNPAAERLTGKSSAEVTAKLMSEIFPPMQAAKIRQDFQRCIEAETAITYEECLNLEGKPYWLLTTLHPLKDNNGRIYQLIGTSIDISDRKQREEVLRQITLGVSAETGEAFFHSLVECLSKALNIEYAFVGELARPAGERIGTIAVFSDGRIVPNRDRILRGTPCEQVVNCRQICVYNCQVQDIFPQDLLLAEMGFESYIGIPLVQCH